MRMRKWMCFRHLPEGNFSGGGFSCRDLVFAAFPSSRRSPRFVLDTDVANMSAPIDRLDHVDDVQCRGANTGEGLHFDAGAIRSADLRADGHAVRYEFHINVHPG